MSKIKTIKRYALADDQCVFCRGGAITDGETPDADELWTYREALAERRNYREWERPGLVEFELPA